MRERPERFGRAAFRLFRPLSTRWMDNDAYGHLNNVVYYSLFDTAVNAHLIENGFLELGASPAIGLVVETGCTYFDSLAFPEPLEAGLAVAELGRSSVRYAVAVFRQGADLPSAQGHFVHVYVDRLSRQPVPIPPALRETLERLRP